MKYLLLVVFENKKTRVYFVRKEGVRGKNRRNSGTISRIFNEYSKIALR